jgi:hypothetical protein
MKVQVQSINLTPATTDDDSRFVKAGALLFFRGVRALAGYIAEVPAVATQAAADIADAWEESSRPNA